jgi:erythromycin esterase-like protein
MHDVITYLETVDPEPPWLGWRCALCCSGRYAAAPARQRYSCFDHASADDDGQASGFAKAFGAGQSCEQEAVEQLIDFQRNSVDYARRDGLLAEDELSNSVEELFHETDADAFYVKVRDDGRPSAQPLDDIWLGRAIGVIYLPATERQSHYFHVRPADQFDAMIHIDNTRALEPLELTSEWIAGDLHDTYPTGL